MIMSINRGGSYKLKAYVNTKKGRHKEVKVNIEPDSLNSMNFISTILEIKKYK